MLQENSILKSYSQPDYRFRSWDVMTRACIFERDNFSFCFIREQITYGQTTLSDFFGFMLFTHNKNVNWLVDFEMSCVPMFFYSIVEVNGEKIMQLRVKTEKILELRP